jgi:hypothetical protein
MDNECSVVDYTSGDPFQCKKGAVRFGYCWEHMPQYYKDVLRLTPRAVDEGESAPLQAESTPEVLPIEEADTTPALRN